LYKKLAKYDKALAYLEKARKIQEKILGKNHPDTAKTYDYMGELYKKLANFDKALAYLEKARKIQEKILGKNHPDIATTYNYIGEVYYVHGDYVTALKYAKKSKTIREEKLGINNLLTAFTYNDIGLYFKKLGDYQNALKYYKKALKVKENILDKQSYSIAIAYNNMAFLYLYQKEYKQAYKYFKNSLVIREQKYGKQSLSTARAYNNMGFFYAKIGDYPRALKYYKQAVIIREKKLGKEHPYTATSYNEIGRVYEKIGIYQKSFKYLIYALKINKNVFGDKNIRTAEVYKNLGILYKNIKQLKKAYAYSKKALDIFLYNRDKNFAYLANKQKLMYVKSNAYYMYIFLKISNDYLNELKSKHSPKAYLYKVKQEIFNHWLSYKGAVSDSENLISMLIQYSDDKEVVNLAKRLKYLKDEYAKLFAKTPKSKQEKEEKERRLKEIEEEKSEIEAKLSSKSERFKEELGLKKISFKDIVPVLNKDTIYIDFAKTDNFYYIFTLDNKSNITFIQIPHKDTKQIDKEIKSFRKDIKDIVNLINKKGKITKKDLKPIDEKSKKTLRTLYTLIIKSIENNIKDKKEFIISPDGLLNLIPFEALIDENGKYMIEKYKIEYIPSGKEFVRSIKRSKIDKKFKTSKNVIFANINYDFLNLNTTDINTNISNAKMKTRSILGSALKDGYFPQLNNTKEVEEFKKIFKNKSVIYEGENATKYKLKKIKTANIIHIATHGVFLQNSKIKNPMLKSWLAFAGANSYRFGNYKGLASALEISGLDIKGEPLVVLSACETGIGEIINGEGVSSLAKAFLQAGAKQVVMSLWSVEDKNTAELMSNFYEKVAKEKKDYIDALREAKIEMIKQDKHPFFWSAFIISGIGKIN